MISSRSRAQTVQINEPLLKPAGNVVICHLCVYFTFQRNTCCFPEFLDSIDPMI